MTGIAGNRLWIKTVSTLYVQIGESGKSTRQLEKTIALLKKVVERVQSENEQLKKAPGVVSNDRLQNLQSENEGLKVCYLLICLKLLNTVCSATSNICLIPYAAICAV